MAISLLGVSTAGAAATGSQNINVPTGTTSVILMAGGWDSAGATLSAATLDGISFSFTAGYQVAPSGNTQGYYLADISNYTGSTGATISLGYTCSSTIDEGLVFGIFFFSGADTTGMIRAKDFDTHEGGGGVVLTTTVTSVSTDIVIGGAVGYTADGPADVGAPASQTESASAASNSDTGSFGFEITTGASSTTFTTNSIDYAALTTVSIEEAAASGGITNTNMVGSSGRIAGNYGGLVG